LEEKQGSKRSKGNDLVENRVEFVDVSVSAVISTQRF
jgi:hypothetical protein